MKSFIIVTHCEILEQSVGGRIVSKWIVKKLDGRMWTGLILLMRHMLKSFEHLIETLRCRSALGRTVGAGMSFPQNKAACV